MSGDDELRMKARQTGAQTVSAVRRALARQVANLIRSDPAAADTAVEMGLIDRGWLENPLHAPIATSTPAEVFERFLERAVEQRPSRLSELGLSAVQMLSSIGVRGSGDPERVAVAFTDLEGFTAYTDQHGDAAALALLHEHHRLAGPVVRRAGGRVVKRLGDGLLCTWPQAASGVRAVVGLLETAPTPLRLRAGMHVGEAVVSQADVIGHVVNVAARVAEAARGGQALVTAEVAEAAGPDAGVVFGRPRSRRLKGISEKVPVLEVRKGPAGMLR